MTALFSKMFDLVKRVWLYITRVAALEKRVTKLEEALAKQPADACPRCGERALRAETAGGVTKGEPPKQYREDTWKCEKCRWRERRVVYFK
jgi:hypothetical protein